MPTYFSDRIREVTILAGVARIEFHRLETVRRGGNREARTASEMIVALLAQGLVQALGVFQRLRDQLIKDGLLKPGEPAPQPPLPAKSPNFS
jgi:hypothetical protein